MAVAIAGIILPIVIIGSQQSGALDTVGLRSAVDSVKALAAPSLPAKCGVNGDLIIKDQTYSGEGPAITAALNCTIRIENSHLTSDVIVEGSLNNTVTVVGSELRASETAISLPTNGKLYTSRETKIYGGETAVRGGINLEVTLKDTLIEADEVGIDGGQNLTLMARNSPVRGKEVALCGGGNAEIEVRSSAITGREALRFRRKPRKLELRGSELTGAQLFGASSCR